MSHFEIISNGTPGDTHVYYNGEDITNGISDIELNVTAATFAKATLTVTVPSFNWEVLPVNVTIIAQDAFGEAILTNMFTTMSLQEDVDPAFVQVMTQWKEQHDKIRQGATGP